MAVVLGAMGFYGAGYLGWAIRCVDVKGCAVFFFACVPLLLLFVVAAAAAARVLFLSAPQTASSLTPRLAHPPPPPARPPHASTSDDGDLVGKAKELHPKLSAGMFIFFALGASGGMLSLLMQGM